MQWKVVIVALSLSLSCQDAFNGDLGCPPAARPVLPTAIFLSCLTASFISGLYGRSLDGWMDGWQEEYLHESFLLHRHDYGDGDLNGNMRNMLPMPVHPAVFVENNACNHTSGSF